MMMSKTVFTPLPPGGCRICLIRHGETSWNIERRLQGHRDIPLNSTGLMQAHATARALKDKSFSALYSSDLQRAQQTAVAISEVTGLPIQIDPRLRERHYGIFQGLTHAETRQQHPESYAFFKNRVPGFAPAEGESLNDMAARIQSLLSALAQKHHGGQILVITHGGVLDIAYRLATGMALQLARDFLIPNAGLNWIEWDGDAWKLLAWAIQQDSLAHDELP